MTFQPDSPFNQIKVNPNEQLKIFDFLIPARNEETGRVRILALVPRKPNPLANIKVAVAWCAPSDAPKFTKERSNAIMLGRYLKAESRGWDRTSESKDDSVYRNTGIIHTELASLKNFFDPVSSVVCIPGWVDMPTYWDVAGL